MDEGEREESAGAGDRPHGDRNQEQPRVGRDTSPGRGGEPGRGRRGRDEGDRSRRDPARRTAEDRFSSGTSAPRRGGGPRGLRASRGDGGSGRDRAASSRPGVVPGRARGATGPPLPDDVQAAELAREVRAELASLAAANADTVARHLVMAGRLVDEDPELAYRHAVAARERAGRVGAVREAAGLTAYHAGHYAEALAELRAARRISGDQSLLPVMADCERGLGRPERALEMAASPEAAGLDPAARVELLIVASGARRDLGQPEAAALMLRGPWLRPDRRRPWSARLFYAYAAALAEAGRTDEALEWFGHALEADDEGETDAAERLVELRASTD